MIVHSRLGLLSSASFSEPAEHAPPVRLAFLDGRSTPCRVAMQGQAITQLHSLLSLATENLHAASGLHTVAVKSKAFYMLTHQHAAGGRQSRADAVLVKLPSVAGYLVMMMQPGSTT